MTTLSLFKVRETLERCICENVKLENDSLFQDSDSQLAIEMVSNKPLATEIAWTVKRCVSKAEFSSTVLNMAHLVTFSRIGLSVSQNTQLTTRLICISNEVCSILIDCGVEADRVVDFVSIFLSGCCVYVGHRLNALLFMMSRLSAAPENAGHKRTASSMRNNRLCTLICAAMTTFDVSVEDAESSFLSSPNLRTVMTSAFEAFRDTKMKKKKKTKKQLLFVSRMSNLLGLVEEEEEEEEEDKEEEKEEEDLLDILGDATESDILDCFEAVDAGDAGDAEVSTPDKQNNGRTTPCTPERRSVSCNQVDSMGPILVFPMNIFPITDNKLLPPAPPLGRLINLSQTSLLATFRISKGVVSKAIYKKAKRATQTTYSMLFCDETI